MRPDPVALSDLPAPPLVLIVAPDWDYGRFLRSHLALQGFDAFIALSLEDATELMSIHVCDIVMADISYFGTAVLEFFQRVRARSPQVCLVAIGPEAHSGDGSTIDALLPAHPDAAILGLTLAAMMSRRYVDATLSA